MTAVGVLVVVCAGLVALAVLRWALVYLGVL